MFLFFQPLNQRVIVQLFFCLATIWAYLYVFSFFPPLYSDFTHLAVGNNVRRGHGERRYMCEQKKVISTQKARRKEIMWFLEAPSLQIETLCLYTDK